MIRVVGIGGEPATGKTTVMREVIARLGGAVNFSPVRMGLLQWLRHRGRPLVVLGDYREGTFGGTDRLSMAVQPEALRVLLSWASDPSSAGLVVLFEGDRLFNRTLIDALNASPDVDAHWFLLSATPAALTGRHLRRGDLQTPLWLKGRRSKAERLAKAPGVETLTHEEPDDTAAVVAKVLEAVGRPSAVAQGGAGVVQELLSGR